MYNQELEEQIYNLSKIVLSQEGETWLVRINDQPKIVEVLVAEDVDCDVPDAIDILSESIKNIKTIMLYANKDTAALPPGIYKLGGNQPILSVKEDWAVTNSQTIPLSSSLEFVTQKNP